MKITTLILITAILHVSATTLAQKVTLNEKNAPLADVFNDISAQTNYDFAFTTDALKNAKSVTINVKNVELSDALAQILQGQNLEFSIDNKTVVIKPKETSFVDNLKNKIKAELSQTTVTGKVLDGTGQPIPGVNVREKGTQNGTVTDSKGKYTLTVANDKSIVTFSYIGYEPQELAAKNLPDGATIILKASSQNLQEVVINKGYYDEKRELSTSDVGEVTAKEIEEQPVSDPIQALIGRVPGLNIQQTSGIPGAYATIQIRGLNSIANGTAPYYVIDGVPFDPGSLSDVSIPSGALGAPNLGTQPGGGGVSPFNAINPDDIESIEILKDADATAIYGTKGANGVVLITTKKGKAGETKVTFDLSQGIEQVGHFMNLLNTQQYLQMRHQAFANDGIPFPTLSDAEQGDPNFDVNGVWDTTRNTNWQKVLIGGTAHYTNAQGSISGGNANTQFLIGGGYTRQTTVYPGDYGDQKGSLHFSLSNTSSNHKFKMTLSASYVNDNNFLPPGDFTGNALTLPPDAPVLYNRDGSLNWQIFNGTGSWTNPLATTLTTATSISNNLVSNLNLSYLLLPGLLLQSNFGYNHDEMNQTNLFPATAVTPPYNTNPDFNESEFAYTLSQGWIIEPQLSFQRKIAKGELSILLGGTLQQSNQQSMGEAASGFSNPALISDPQAATYFQSFDSSYHLYRYEALLGRISYTWDNKYLLNVTANRDGSTRFGPGKQFGNFGAIGAGWILSQEKFIKDAIPWLSFGKIRASYGTTGNDQIGDYQYLSYYSAYSKAYQGVSGFLPNSLANPDYSWEVDKKLEVGLDLGFLKNTINFSIDYYRNRTSNQLVGYGLPSVTGFTSVEENLPAVVQNTGLEISLNSTNIKTKDFNWTTTANFTLPKNELVSYPGFASSPYVHTYTVGQSLFSLQRFQYEGVDPQTGFYTFAGQNGNTSSPSFPQDLVTSQPITQKYYGGIGNDFSYKGFSLDIFIQFVKQLGYNYLYYVGNPAGSANLNFPTAVLTAWQNAGQVTNVEKFSTEGPYQYYNYNYSTGAITDASFIRLKNVAFAYKLPVAWQQWAHMQNARIYVQGQNLYTFTHYIGLDPETQGLSLPPLRTIVMGVSASF